MGWHDTTPTFWMYSFRLQKIVRMCNAVFSKSKLPFRNLTVLVNGGDLTDEMVAAMHAADVKLLFPEPAQVQVTESAQVQVPESVQVQGQVPKQVQWSDNPDALSQSQTQ
eukprot:2921046-Rhodomonas_salina.1